MTSHQGVFGHALCAIEIEPRPVVDGGLIYVATPYVVDDARQIYYWFENPQGHPVEIFGASEDHALRAASEYLVQEEGPLQQPLRMTASSPAPERRLPMCKRNRSLGGVVDTQEFEVVLTPEEIRRSTQSLLHSRRLPFSLDSVDVDETIRVIRLRFQQRGGGDFVAVDCSIAATSEDVKRAVVRRLADAPGR